MPLEICVRRLQCNSFLYINALDIIYKTMQTIPRELENIFQPILTHFQPIKKVFWNISQNSQESAWVAASFFNKVTGLVSNLIKKRLQQRCLTVNFAKLFRTPFSQNISGRLQRKLRNTVKHWHKRKLGRNGFWIKNLYFASRKSNYMCPWEIL